MISVDPQRLELVEFWHEEESQSRGRGGFPFIPFPETSSVGMVYFEIQPGDSLGLHTDSPDEVIVVLSGTAEATIGDETGVISAGSVAFIPSMAPHGFKNIGDDVLRCVGVFPDSDVESTFEYELQPFGTRVLRFKDLAQQPV